MRVVIVGGGKVGRRLVEELTDEGEDVILIEKKSSVCERIQEAFDVMCIAGSGADIRTLDEAEIKKADLFIAVTDNDELNALCSVMAKRMGADRCVARVRKREYFKQLDFMRNALGINLIVNPEFTTAGEISRVLRFPAAVQAETFAKGRIELIAFNVPEDSVLCGKSIAEVYKKLKIKVLICAVQRDGEVYIPNGDFVLNSGDTISITASHHDLSRFMSEIGVIQKKVRTVMVIGGGRISFYLAKLLLESGLKVKIIEIDMQRCLALSEHLPKADVVCGDGTDWRVLEEEGIDRVDALVSLTGIDEENMIISMYAKTRSVDKIITKINRETFAQLMAKGGTSSIVTPKNITANLIIRYARAMKSAQDTEMRTLYRIVDNKAEAIEFIINRDSVLTEKPLSEIRLKSNVLIAAVLRHNKMFTPDGACTLTVGDTIIVVTTERIQTLGDILN